MDMWLQEIKRIENKEAQLHPLCISSQRLAYREIQSLEPTGKTVIASINSL